MKDEAEFAIKYSEERKMRMALEDRLHGLMYETIALYEGNVELINAVASADSDRVTNLMKTLTEWRTDVEAQVHLNFFEPAGKKFFFSKKDLHVGGLEQIPNDGFKKARDFLGKRAKKSFDRWIEITEEEQLTPLGLVRIHYMKELSDLVKKTMQKFHTKEEGEVVH